MPVINKSIVVIFGAGASYDLIPDNQYGQVVIADDCRPPLTPNLFSLSSRLESYLTEYPRAYTAIGALRSLVARGEKSLEELLRDLKESGEENKMQQFRQIPLYLKHLFTVISQNYCRHPINYTTLISETLRKSIDAVAYVSLNYDLLFEKALTIETGTEFLNIDEYIPTDEKWMFVKLHGSANWGRKLKKVTNPGETLPALLDSVAHINPETDLDENIQINSIRPDKMSNGLEPYYPALTVPIDGKYELNCPPEHLSKLKSLIKICDTYLIIGVSGKDKDLLDLLKENVSKAKLVTLVGGKDVKESKDRFMSAIPQFQTAQWIIHDDGFSSFIKYGQLEHLI